MHVSRTYRVRDAHRGFTHDPRAVLKVIELIQREMRLDCEEVAGATIQNILSH